MAEHAACRCLRPGPLPNCKHAETDVVVPVVRVIVAVGRPETPRVVVVPTATCIFYVNRELILQFTHFFDVPFAKGGNPSQLN